LPLAACRLPLAACRLPLAACRLPLAACPKPYNVHHFYSKLSNAFVIL